MQGRSRRERPGADPPPGGPAPRTRPPLPADGADADRGGGRGRPPEARRVAAGLAALLRRPTGFPLPVVAGGPGAADGVVSLEVADVGLGAEGYRLRVDRARGAAARRDRRGPLPRRPDAAPAAARRGRAALPPARPLADRRRHVTDRPRYAYRGAMLDVSRHFFTVARGGALHRRARALQAQQAAPAPQRRPGLAHRRRPLAAAGPARRAHRGRRRPGGSYTGADLRAIVRYAADRRRHGRPGDRHAGPRQRRARLLPRADLRRASRRPLYTGIEVGFSSLCATKAVTYASSTTSIGRAAAADPGPLPPPRRRRGPLHDARRLRRASSGGRQASSATYGKSVMGWHEIAAAPVPRGSIAQYWSPASGSAPGTEPAPPAARRGRGSSCRRRRAPTST